MQCSETNESSDRKPEKVISQDYWKISLMKEGFISPDYVALVQGRRRTTEPFWPGLQMTVDIFERFSKTMADARTVALGFIADDQMVAVPVFPNCETLAICNGPYYLLETTETVNGFGDRSVGTTVYTIGEPMLPVLHLIDSELGTFCQDLAEALEAMDALSRAPTNSTVPHIGIL